MKKTIKYYFKSWDGCWWIKYNGDHPNKLYGKNPPKRSKFKIIDWGKPLY